LFDNSFGLDDIRKAIIELTVRGEGGYVLNGSSSMAFISRDPLELVGHAMGAHHQYPDGMMMFLGTMLAPTQDRDAPGQGFTHHVGDVVSVSVPQLGRLVNRVDRSDRIAPWTFGIRALMQSLAGRRP
jgi:fumarylacetoacetate (FAA) hydrolase family protein